MKRILISLLPVFLMGSAWAVETDSVFHRQFRQEIGGWIAADATYSIYLPDGRTLWLFGDTFIGEVDENNAIIPGSKFIHNSAVIQEGNLLETLFTGSRSDPSAFIPSAHPDSTWYWPDHGVVDNDTLRIFLAKFRNNPDAPAGFNFEHAGNDIANFTWPDIEFINVIPVYSHPLNSVFYGDRLLEDSIYIYIYGRRYDDPELNIPYPHAARALKGSLMEQRWEYFDGQAWSTDPQATKRINDFQVSQQYSVSKFREKFILLTQDIWLSPKIYTFTSDSPVGPWDSKRLIYTTPETEQDMFTYNAYAHPQFDQDDKMLVSYNTNGDFWSIFNNVELYRPRFIRVPYMNMDYEFWPNGRDQKEAGITISPVIFPNPVTDFASLSMELRVPGYVSLELIDINGRVFESISPRKYKQGVLSLQLDLQLLPAGIYTCRILLDNKVHVTKLIKSSQ